MLETPPIDVIGLGADGAVGLRPGLQDRIHAAEFLAGGQRQLSYFPTARGERFVIKDNLQVLRQELEDRFRRQRCVVLASGDPLFYGIGKYLVEHLAHVRIEPALSSMQLAFARAGIPWQDAVVASIHGRNLRTTLLPLLGRKIIGLFSQDGSSPAAVAKFFQPFLSAETATAYSVYRATVYEHLGCSEEAIFSADLTDLIQKQFDPLNIMILERTVPEGYAEIERRRALAPGIPDEAFARPTDQPEVLTRQEVRSVALAKLLGPSDPGDTAWDIGAGLGTVALEIAILRPGVETLAVEKDADRSRYLRENRRRFDALNVRILEGSAPDVLVGETERPRLVFIGGSGGRLLDILDLVRERLRPDGCLVANFVTLEHLMQSMDRLRSWNWPFEVSEIQVVRSDALAGQTGLKPQRGVFLVRATKPGGSS